MTCTWASGTVPAGTTPLQAVQLWVPEVVLQPLLLLLLQLAVNQPHVQAVAGERHLLQRTYPCCSWMLRLAVVVALGLLCDVPGLLQSAHVAFELLLQAKGLEVVDSACAARTAAAGLKALRPLLCQQLVLVVGTGTLQHTGTPSLLSAPAVVDMLLLLDYRAKRRPHLLQNAPCWLLVFEDLDHAAVAVAFQA